MSKQALSIHFQMQLTIPSACKPVKLGWNNEHTRLINSTFMHLSRSSRTGFYRTSNARKVSKHKHLQDTDPQPEGLLFTSHPKSHFQKLFSSSFNSIYTPKTTAKPTRKAGARTRHRKMRSIWKGPLLKSTCVAFFFFFD